MVDLHQLPMALPRLTNSGIFRCTYTPLDVFSCKGIERFVLPARPSIDTAITQGTGWLGVVRSVQTAWGCAVARVRRRYGIQRFEITLHRLASSSALRMRWCYQTDCSHSIPALLVDVWEFEQAAGHAETLLKSPLPNPMS